MALALGAGMLSPLSAAWAGGSVNLAGPVWYWTGSQMSDGSQIEPGDPTRYSIQFHDDGTMAFRLDCNRASGRVELGDQSMKIVIGPTTLIACPPDTLAPEFSGQLQSVYAYHMDGSDLILDLTVDSGIMRFAPAAPARQTLTGTVTYLERIALDPGSTVEVVLEETSRLDTAATQIARQVIRPRTQVPIAFSLSFDPGVIDPRGRYSIRARITDSSGVLRFMSTTANPVLTNGAPSDKVEVVLRPVGRAGP
jgi:putative lipoprotein